MIFQCFSKRIEMCGFFRIRAPRFHRFLHTLNHSWSSHVNRSTSTSSNWMQYSNSVHNRPFSCSHCRALHREPYDFSENHYAACHVKNCWFYQKETHRTFLTRALCMSVIYLQMHSHFLRWSQRKNYICDRTIMHWNK